MLDVRPAIDSLRDEGRTTILAVSHELLSKLKALDFVRNHEIIVFPLEHGQPVPRISASRPHNWHNAIGATLRQGAANRYLANDSYAFIPLGQNVRMTG
jgi:hypothetical protein